VRIRLSAVFFSQLPGAMLIDEHLLPPDALAEALHKILQNAGLQQANVTAKGKILTLALSATSDPQRLSVALDTFRATYGKRVTVLVKNSDTGQSLAPNPLPFAIVSITGGDLPSVIVDSGIRLLPGGEYRGYRLVSISDTQMTFDGPTHVVITR